jgi:hypothetical protein
MLQIVARRPLPLRTASALQNRVDARPAGLSRYRKLHVTSIRRDSSFTNILADENPPPVQVKAITDEGISLSDGLKLSSACVFLEGKVFLWDVPTSLWTGWTKDHFEIFETVIPRPGKHSPTLLPLHTNSCAFRNSPAWNRRQPLANSIALTFPFTTTWNSSRRHGHGTFVLFPGN